MKIKLSTIGQPDRQQIISATLNWRKPVALLVIVHTVVSMLCLIAAHTGFSDIIRDVLALPGGNVRPQMLTGLLTHPFVQFNPLAFLLSVGAIWFFGHILQTVMPPAKVIVLYVVTTVLSGIAFLLSHLVFEVFSGYGVVMEGTFAGALGVMTTALVYFRSHQVRVVNTLIPLWQIYLVVLILAFLLISKPSLAYVLAYLASIWFGGQYAVSKLMLEESRESAIGNRES